MNPIIITDAQTGTCTAFLSNFKNVIVQEDSAEKALESLKTAWDNYREYLKTKEITESDVQTETFSPK